jgi:hypothetical protein
MTKNLTNNQKNIVMVRAYGSEPVRLYSIRIYGNIVEVAKTVGSDHLPISRKNVYNFEEKIFKELCEAYNNGDKAELESLWQKAEPIST